MECVNNLTAALSFFKQDNCPPWIRLDRTDGVSDTTPYVRIVDEAVDFLDAPTFPLMIKSGTCTTIA